MDSSFQYKNQITELQEQIHDLQKRFDDTDAQLQEANETLNAIATGQIDALVVKQDREHQLFTLKSADHTYRMFIEQLTEGVITLNENKHILYCNSSFAALVGQPLEKVIGQSFCKFIAANQQDECNLLLTRSWTINTRKEIDIIRDSGELVPVLLSCKRLDVEENLSLSIILTDLSAQKEQQRHLQEQNLLLEKAERHARDLNANLETLVSERTSELQQTIEEKSTISEQLRGNQERLTQILETMAEGVTIMDIDGDIIYANRMAKQLLGFEESTRSGKTIYETSWQQVNVEGVQLLPLCHPVYMALVMRNPVYDYEIGVDPPGKERVYISVNAVPVLNNNHVTGSIGTLMDVTRRRIAIQQKDDFIGVASHELKTPITTLKAALQLLDKLKTDPSNAMLPRLIEQANKGMKKISYLVEDLLDVSRLREGQLRLNKTSFPLQAMLEDTIEHLNIKDRVQVAITGYPNITVIADSGRIEQVIINFINNAIKYAPNANEVQIVVELLEAAVKVSVIDRGPGIAAEKLKHLFDRYFRTDYSGAQYSGLGLGLYISAEIVKKHGGNIGVQSTVGTGSTFWFTLPL